MIQQQRFIIRKLFLEAKYATLFSRMIQQNLILESTENILKYKFDKKIFMRNPNRG